MKRLFFSFLILLAVLSFVSSAVDVRFDVYEAKIIDGERINSNERVSNFYVKGYTCQNVACTIVGEEVDPFSKHSFSDSISLTFPTTLLSPNGYLLYFYKEGYIGYEEYGIKISGTGSGAYPNRLYLSKKDSGKAEIQNLNGVQTEIKNGTKVSLSYDVFADGITQDVLLDERHAKNYELEESTRINSWFILLDESGNKIITEKESDDLEYSGNFSKTFEYTFNSVGIYNVTIISEIADSKILNPKNDSRSFLVNVSTDSEPVIPEEEIYSGISEIVSLEKTYAKILVEQFSTKTNQTGTYNVSSNLTLTISKDNSTLKIDSFILDEKEFNFEYNFPFVSHGKYLVEVLVCPVLEENITCDYKSIVFVIPEDVGENESYFGISNITSLDFYNSSDSNYTFNLEQSSTKTNQTGTYNVSSVLTIEIYNESSKIYFYQDLLDESENNFEFNYNFTSPGTYIVSFTVCPNLPGNFTCSQKNVTIIIPSEDEEEEEKKSKKCCASTNLIDSSIDEEDSSVYSYEEEEEIKLGFKEKKRKLL